MDDHELAADIAREAGELLLELQARQATKDEGDRLSNDLILGRLAEARPDDAVLSEESKDSPERLARERVWIVDPLDGTREWGEGRTDWAVHVALAFGGIPSVATVALPGQQKLLSTANPPPAPPASSGKIRLLVSRTRPPAVAEYLADVLDAELVPLGSAGAKAMAVVMGDADVYAHSGGQYEWDSAAPVGVATAAGCHCSRIDGAPLLYNQPDPYLPDLLICRAELAARVLDAVRAGARSHLSRFLRERLASALMTDAPSPIAPDAVEQCLCVVMPCYNEEATISVIVERVLASPYVRELVIVDDGSRDATLAKIRAFADPRIRVFVQPVNLGKGAALRRGFREATAPFVIVQDADLEYDPEEYGAVLAPLLRGQADVVYGSRFASGQPRRVLYYWHSVGNKLLTTMSNMFTNLNLTDMETCYKAFRLEVLQSLEVEEDRFGFEPEITAKIAAAGWRVWEVSIAYAGRTYAEGKKITWRDGLRAGYSVVRYSSAWSRLRGHLDRAPDRSLAPAEFDDSDSELATVLATLEDAANYSDWIYSLVEPYLGENVLEVGAGYGELTERLQRGRRVTATDLSTNCVDVLRERFAARPNVDVRHVDIAATADGRLYDSVVLINVLEHIDDDENALAKLRQSLRPNGYLCVFVPAFDGLYSDFDHRIGHRRRYRRSHLIEVFDRAGFRIVDARYINTVGALAWWLFVRQLGQVPAQSWSIAFYDRVVIPVLRRAESKRSPRFGQSLLGVGILHDS